MLPPRWPTPPVGAVALLAAPIRPATPRRCSRRPASRWRACWSTAARRCRACCWARSPSSAGRGARPGRWTRRCSLLPAAIARRRGAAGAACGARWCGAASPQPLVLTEPRDIAALLRARRAAWPAWSARRVGTAGARRCRHRPPDDAARFNWATWWVGDTLGMLIGAPIVLTLIGQPRDDWAPRRAHRRRCRWLLVTRAAGAAVIAQLARWDEQRVRADVRARRRQRAATALAGAAAASRCTRWRRCAALSSPRRDVHARRVPPRAARAWLAQPAQPAGDRATASACARASSPAFEAACAPTAPPAIRVFDRRRRRPRRRRRTTRLVVDPLHRAAGAQRRRARRQRAVDRRPRAARSAPPRAPAGRRPPPASA